MTNTNKPTSENVLVTAKVPMNILREDSDGSLDDALQREIDERMTCERAMAFFEDASFTVTPLSEADHSGSP